MLFLVLFLRIQVPITPVHEPRSPGPVQQDPPEEGEEKGGLWQRDHQDPFGFREEEGSEYRPPSLYETSGTPIGSPHGPW